MSGLAVPLELLFGVVLFGLFWVSVLLASEFLCFLWCFFLPVLVSVEFWSVPVPVVPPAEVSMPVLELPVVPIVDAPLPDCCAEPELELDPEVPDCPPVADPLDCAAAMPIENSAAVAIARSFLDIRIS